MIWDFNSGIGLVVSVVLLFFVIWMFIDMLKNRRISQMNKVVYAVLFLVASIIMAVVWFFIRKNARRW